MTLTIPDRIGRAMCAFLIMVHVLLSYHDGVVVHIVLRKGSLSHTASIQVFSQIFLKVKGDKISGFQRNSLT